MDGILTTARDLELEVNEDDIEELIMGHGDELTIEELQEILNEEHQETTKWTKPTVPNSVYATLCPEVREQTFRSGGESDSKTLSVKFPSKLGTHFIPPLKG
ncbi:hypothetical protein TNCV_955351 [Trichonephila clavipes]|nr:hypothetical protein TNCV_955351 [Trichonephila clavipes]